MNSLALKFGCGFSGLATGITGNSELKSRLGRVARISVSGASKQVYDYYRYSLAGAATLQLDLSTGLTNPLNESISGAADFATITGVFLEHDSTSTSTSFTAFNGGTNEFQGPMNAASDCTLVPGEWFAFGKLAGITGWTVDGTHKRIDILNNHATNAALINIFILGTV